jgi:alpha-glucoside transport system substrate-binding protein
MPNLLRRRFAAIVAIIAIISLLAVACGDDNNSSNTTTPGSSASAGASAQPSASGTSGAIEGSNLGDVNVIGIWGSDELNNFDAMVKPWEDKTGGNMKFTGTRDITAQLNVRVQGGNPPDVAIPAELGLFKEYAQQGKIISLDQCKNGLADYVKANYPKAFLDLATVNGKLYGFFMKADTKATIWYNPKWFKDNGLKPLGADSSWDDLANLAKEIKAKGIAPWSIGLESGEASGWPGTDWIQQIILNQEGVDTYDGLVDGSVKFTDPKVKDAWEKFGQMALTDGYTSQGGAAGINATNFQDSAYPPFMDPPKAGMVFLGSFTGGFVKDQFPDAKAGTDYDFFTWPGGKVSGSANIVYAFKANPTVCSYLKYLASAQAQTIWVKKGGFTSVNKQVSTDAYPSDVAKKVAEQLLNAQTFRFDLDDAIGGSVQTAYFKAVTQYISNPGSLDSLLSGLDSTRAAAATSSPTGGAGG